jgi:hypothetical protein
LRAKGFHLDFRVRTIGGEFSGRRPPMRCQDKQNASRFCERNKAETPRLPHLRKLLFPMSVTAVLWSHASA